MICRISVVMLSYNSARYLSVTVPALIAALVNKDNTKIKDEIWIVDNGSTDDSVQIIKALQRKYPEIVKPVYNHKNFGTTVSRNQALSRVSGQYVLVLDSDIIGYSTDAIHSMCRQLDASPDIGLIVPKLVYKNKNYQLSTDVFPSPLRKFKRFMGLKKQESTLTPPSHAVDVDYAISAFWLMPRRTLGTVGLLDENIFYAPEDVDYCIRIWKAGLRIVYDPAHTVVHDAQEIGRSVWQVKRWPFIVSHIKGLLYMFVKHRYLSRRMLVQQMHRKKSGGTS